MDYVNNRFVISFHWSLEVVMITILGLLITVGAIFLLFSKKSPLNIIYLKCILSAPIIIFLLYLIHLMPCSLSVDATKIYIRRVFDVIEIPLNTIRLVEAFDSKELDVSQRIVGSAGMFGYIGLYKNDRLGEFTIYATEKKGLTMIQTEKKIFLVSCSNREDLMKTINQNISRLKSNN